MNYRIVSTPLHAGKTWVQEQMEAREYKLRHVREPFCVVCIEPMTKAALDGRCGWCRHNNLKAVRP